MDVSCAGLSATWEATGRAATRFPTARPPRPRPGQGLDVGGPGRGGGRISLRCSCKSVAINANISHLMEHGRTNARFTPGFPRRDGDRPPAGRLGLARRAGRAVAGGGIRFGADGAPGAALAQAPVLPRPPLPPPPPPHSPL